MGAHYISGLTLTVVVARSPPCPPGTEP